MSAAPLQHAPEHYGRYRLIERIGRGGMAEIFRAYVEGFEGFRDTFVIKRIRPEKADSAELVELFCHEARVCALLSHPNIVEMYDFGQIGGAYFMAMEYLRGRDLSVVMRACRLQLAAVPPAVAAHVAAQVALGLDHAHRAKMADGRPAGIVHRDVTPSNIMLLSSGGVKVLDFGIAKTAELAHPPGVAPRKRRIKGKLAYLSPEQVRGADLDGRSDVFSLGVVLWEMLAGQRLFAADNEFQTLRNVLTAPVPPPSSRRSEVPAALDAVVLRALARDRDARIPSAAAFADALAAARGEAFDGARGVAELLAALLGDGAPVPPERMTGSFGAMTFSSLGSESRARTTAEERALAALIAGADVSPVASSEGPPPASAAAPAAPLVPAPRRRHSLAAGLAVVVAVTVALAAWRLTARSPSPLGRAPSRAEPGPSRSAGTASAGM